MEKNTNKKTIIGWGGDNPPATDHWSNPCTGNVYRGS